MTRRPPYVVVLAIVVAVVIAGTVGMSTVLRPSLSASSRPGGGIGNGSTDQPSSPGAPTPVPTAHPVPGHEVYGFVPYWLMDGTIAAHLAKTDLTTLELFSVTHKSGHLDQTQNGYKKITGTIGQQLISEAHGRGVRVELVYTSFTTAKNTRFFGGPLKTQDTVITDLVNLASQLGVDGVDVDVEQLDGDLVPAYGAFIGRLRTALRVKHADWQVSVATTANESGAAMAAAAAQAGADRIFLQGYDYHYPASDPGASAPIARRDGSEKDLPWSLDLYDSLGVPVQRTILGLPLYGVAWAVDSTQPDASVIGTGVAWIPSDHQALLDDPSIVPVLDPVEQVDIYTVPRPVPSGSPPTWLTIYLDSPATLALKMGLAQDRGLAGAGFWAVGYDRGWAGISDLIHTYATGKLGQ